MSLRIPLPQDTSERIAAMVRLVRGECVTVNVNGKPVVLTPSQYVRPAK